MNVAEFSVRFPAELVALLEGFSASLVDVASDRMGDYLSAREPEATGKLKRSRVYVRSSATEKEHGYTDPKAMVLNQGRKRSKPYTRKTKSGGKSAPIVRVLGSKQAPRGMTRGAFRQLRQEWPEIIEAAAHETGGLA